MSEILEKKLLEATGKNQELLSSDNPYREIGFDGGKKRLGWVRVTPYKKIEGVLVIIIVRKVLFLVERQWWWLSSRSCPRDLR